MEITDLNQSMDLNIFKCRNVKTPTKAWDAAGWDFYIPEDLHLTDFMKSASAYLDDSVIHDNNSKYSLYQIPLIFTISSSYSEVDVILYLAWNFDKNEWRFKISFYNELERYEITDIRVHGVFDKESIITKIVMLPHASINIPSGIHMNLPNNIFLQAANKSGIGSKRRLTYLAQVIDPDYEGEVHLNLINLSELKVTIKAGEKIIQMLPMFKPNMRTAKEFSSLEELFKDKNSQRGAGGFGSSRN